MLPDLSTRELDERLTELERELGPRLRSVYRGMPLRAGFARELGNSLIAAKPPPALRIVSRTAWAALAATVVGAMVVGVAVFAYQPQTVNASDVLGELQNEAIGLQAFAPGPGCGAAGAQKTTGGAVIAVQTGSASEPSGPVTVSNASDLSDRLGAALGVSGDRVREAMLATMKTSMPPMPADPMELIAKQLGVSTEQVCTAFASSGEPSPNVGFTVSAGKPGQDANGPVTAMGVNGKSAINLDTVTADDLKEPAAKLGVSPERLVDAVKAAAPQKPLPAPPNPDELIHSLAQNLGMSEDKVRTAITQVEGKNGFYFAVPLPRP